MPGTARFRARAGGLLVRALSLVVLAGAALASEAVVEGCNERNPGEIGVRELVGDVGDTVAVAITVHTLGEVRSFSLDVGFPTDLLRYVGAEPGELTTQFFFFGANFLPEDGEVRLSGADRETAIAAGSSGALGKVLFEVIAAGSGAFSTDEYLDDIAPYIACEDVNPTTALEHDSFGRIKTIYRAPR